MAGMTWLHLSDWHQRGKDFDREIVLDALIEDIRNRAENIHTDLAKIDFIIFSGDVAFSGQAEEYQTALKYLFTHLLEVTGLRREQIFIVPGNHDLDRNEFRYLSVDIKQPFDTDKQVNDWLTVDKDRNHLLQPFAAYEKFVKEFTGQERPAYTSIRSFVVDNKQVALLGLNSALMSGRHIEKGEVNDYGFLVVGEPQVYEPLKEIAKAEVRITVIHHPFEWLADFDRDRVENRLRRGCHFILCGHQHKPNVIVERGIAGDCVTIPAGASYDRRVAQNPRYTNSYNFVHLDFETAQGTVYLRRWSEQRNEWIEDIDSSRGGLFKFSLPKSLLPTAPEVVTPSNLQNPQQQSPIDERAKNEQQSSSQILISREDLLDLLSNCPHGVFIKIVFYLNLPAGIISSERTSQAERAAELIRWAEHPDGPGLQALYESYERAIGKKKS